MSAELAGNLAGFATAYDESIWRKRLHTQSY